VLVREVGLVTRADQLHVRPDAPRALSLAAQLGLALVVVTNQTVVARGMLSEPELSQLHASLARQLGARGAPPLDGVYVCPHHPRADVPDYRLRCDCRKPRPGLLQRAAAELSLDLSRSFIVGDRASDIAAGHACGATGILLSGPATAAAPIEGAERLGRRGEPQKTVRSLYEAVLWIARGAGNHATSVGALG
jgi:D-glycero-D-manno-heptose 1,7-bisphosphate phosphatase